MGNTLNENDLKMLQTIRRIPGCTKSSLANKLHLPWSSAYAIINKLNNKIHIFDDFNSTKFPTQSPSPAGIYINRDYEYYVGISVGSSQLKVVILGFDFSVVNISTASKTYQSALSKFYESMTDAKYLGFTPKGENLCRWCLDTPCNMEELSHTLIKICRGLCILKDNQVPIAAVNFALPGHIDFYGQKIISTGHLCNDSNSIQNSDISRLISNAVYEELLKKGINLYIDHNVKCSAFAEKEQRFTKCQNNDNLTNDDLIIAYLGKGVGISLITNNRLYRDVRNDAGQFGHVSVFWNGKKSTLEDVIDAEILSKFGKDKNPTAVELKNFLLDTENAAAKKCLCEVLVQALSDVIYIIGIEHIVFTGKLDEILDVIAFDLMREFEAKKLSGIHLLNSAYGEYSAAIGAAMSCFNLLYGMDYSWY